MKQETKNENLQFYLQTSLYTNYIPFQAYYESLPDEIESLALLVNHQAIHRLTLLKSYLESTALKEQYPWYKYRCQDDILLTAPAMTAELFRQDSRGFTMEREAKDKIVVTCRYVSVLMASILKAKGIPARVRSGFCNIEGRYQDQVEGDHWIVQYYDTKEKNWNNLDVNRIHPENIDNQPYLNLSEEQFTFAAKAWLAVRNQTRDVTAFRHGIHYTGLAMLAHSLFFDFHALMNDEISYLFFPTYLDSDQEFKNLAEEEWNQLDHLATLLLDPDQNFDELRYLFYNDKTLRAINTPLVGDADHLEMSD